MNEQRFIARDYQTIQNAREHLTGVDCSESEPVEIIIRPYKEERSIPANALSHVWYKEIGDYKSMTPLEAKCYCKLHFGVPIMRADDEKFRKLYDKAIKGVLSYEEKLGAMIYLPVTSLMNKEQMFQYLRDMQMTLGQEGIPLASPMDGEYYEWSKCA